MNNTMEENQSAGPMTKGLLAGVIVGVVVLSVAVWLGIDFFLFHRVQARKKERKLYNFYTSLDKGRLLGYTAKDALSKENSDGRIRKKPGKFNKILTFLKIRKPDDDEAPKRKIRRSQSVGLPHNTPTTENNITNDGISTIPLANEQNNQIQMDTRKDVARSKPGTSVGGISRQNVVGHLDVPNDNRHLLPPLDVDMNERRFKQKNIFSIGEEEESISILQTESDGRQVNKDTVLKQIYSQIPRGGLLPSAFELDDANRNSVMNFVKKNDSSKSENYDS